MSNLVDRYLNYLFEYTTYNPSGSGYGMMLQRWNIAGSGVVGKNAPNPAGNITQKIVKKDIEIKTKDEKKGGKKKSKE